MASQPIIIEQVRVLTDAPTRFDNAVDPIAVNDVPVDGRGLATLLDFAPRVGALVNFFDLDDQVDGNWTELFLGDPTMILAAILEADAEAHHREFLAARQRYAAGIEPSLAHRAGTALLRLALGFDRWLAGAGRAPGRRSGRLLFQLLSHEVGNRLAPPLRALKEHDHGERRVRIGLNYARLSPSWGLGVVSTAGAPDPRPGDAPDTLRLLDGLYRPLFDSLDTLREFARKELAISLTASDHPPQIALYIAFAELFAYAQQSVNRTTREYARFYYRDVLRAQEAGPVPDQVYLAFLLADDEAVGSTGVPRDTLFSAGETEQGGERIYGLDTAVDVAGGRLAHIRTLRRVAGPLYLGEAQRADPVPVVTTQLLVGAALFPDPLLDPPSDPTLAWPTFGADRVGADGAMVTRAADIGFALASPLLQLGGGERDLCVGVLLDGVYFSGTLWPRIAALAAATGLEPPGLMRTLLGAAFHFAFSTADGWLPWSVYTVEYGQSGHPQEYFELHLTVPAGVAPITALGGAAPDQLPADADAAAANPHPALPTLKAYLRQQPVILTGTQNLQVTDVYPLAVFGELAATDIVIGVQVKGLIPEQLRNTDGPLDPSGPFAAFGGLPAVGSYLQLGAADLFVKRPLGLGVHLVWFNLPSDPPSDEKNILCAKGFEGYYRGYVIGPDGKNYSRPLNPKTPDCSKTSALFDNQVFRGRFALVNPGLWALDETTQSEPAATEPYLFRAKNAPKGSKPGQVEPDPADPCLVPTPDKDKPLCPATWFGGLQCSPTAPPDGYDPAASALRLTLTSPPYAFGNSLYAVNVLNAVIKALPPAAAATALEDYPNAPWLPQLTAVTVDYAAEGGLRIDAKDGNAVRLAQLTPFGGYCEVSSVDLSKAVALLPLPVDAGSLLLGFAPPLPTGDLSLLVQVRGAGAPTLGEPARCGDAGQGGQRGAADAPDAGRVTWARLVGDRWELLGDALLVDRTDGLRASGELLLRLPSPPDLPHTVLESGYQWLAATVRNQAAVAPTVAIYPYVGRASARLAIASLATAPLDSAAAADGAPWLATPLPAGTIVGAVEDLPAIGGIAQPLPSFGGRPAEDTSRFHIRLGQRLRHKDRAALGWDYERLVLEAFPEVWQVAVLPAQSPTGRPAAGQVVVAIVPADDALQQYDPTAPSANAELLQRIRDYLCARTTPFVRLAVVNPYYVRITVDAEVQFADGLDRGAAIARLDQDLVRYLSPWFYDLARAATAGHYVTEEGIVEFILSRGDVEGLVSLRLSYSPALDAKAQAWCYLTSATAHRIKGVATPACGPRACLQWEREPQ